MKYLSKLGLITAICLNLAIPQSAIAISTSAADAHAVKGLPKTRPELKEITGATLALYTNTLKEEADITERYAEEKHDGKTFIQASNEILPCKTCKSDKEKEKTMAKFIAMNLVEYSQDRITAVWKDLAKKYDEVTKTPTSDAQSDELAKRWAVAMANWDPKGKKGTHWEPEDKRMKVFYEAFMEVKGEFEKLRNDQDKVVKDAVENGSLAAKRALWGDPTKPPEDKANRLAVGPDIFKKMAHWAENGQEGKAIAMWKALAKDNTTGFKNAKDEAVNFASMPMERKGILSALKDPKLFDWQFTGEPLEGAKEMVWLDGKIAPKPTSTGGVFAKGNGQGGSTVPATAAGAQPGSSSALSPAAAAKQIDLSQVQGCGRCHGQNAGKMKPAGRAAAATASGSMPPDTRLPEAQKQAIASTISNLAGDTQVAAK